MAAISSKTAFYGHLAANQINIDRKVDGI